MSRSKWKVVLACHKRQRLYCRTKKFSDPSKGFDTALGTVVGKIQPASLKVAHQIGCKCQCISLPLTFTPRITKNPLYTRTNYYKFELMCPGCPEIPIGLYLRLPPMGYVIRQNPCACCRQHSKSPCGDCWERSQSSMYRIGPFPRRGNKRRARDRSGVAPEARCRSHPPLPLPTAPGCMLLDLCGIAEHRCVAANPETRIPAI